MNQAIRVEGLHVCYKGKHGKRVDAVNGLSFHVAPGEIVGFLGPNGAGKSSTLKALMGFAEPAAGECDIFGLPAGTVEAKRRIGYLPEVALYYPYLTPLETLTLYGELQGLRGRELRNEALRLLETVGLADATRKQNRTLSKGMLQRVGIAQSLLGSPELLILDEVTSGLDPLGRQELRTLLKERQEQGATLFFSSHELAEVDMLCDRILVVDRGVLIEERDMRILKDELRRYVLNFRGVVKLEGLTDRWEELPDGSYLASFENKDALLGAIERAHDSQAIILDVVAQEGSLEHYFIETIRRAA